MDAPEQPADADPLLAVYPTALPQVYGYLLMRCRSVAIAEDLAAETFMAALAASRQGKAPAMSVAWLIGIARHKLVDHWRRRAREERGLAALDAVSDQVDDPWAEWLDAEAAHAALAQLSVQHRIALTLRYLDALPVAQVAEHFERSVHATETLLARARAALRRIYREGGKP